MEQRTAVARPTPSTPATTEPPPDALLRAGAHLHFIGIGGCGMSGLARMLASRGAIIGGSDLSPSPVTDGLIADRYPVSFDQGAGVIPEACDAVVVSAAVKPDNAEQLAAIERGLPIYTYAEALGLLMGQHTAVAVAGTHGKSTTCAMLAHTLIRAGIDPSVIVGATCAHLAAPGAPPTGFRQGGGEIASGPLAGKPGVLIAESCEFNRSFHRHRPTIGAITSVEADHLDIYGSIDEIVVAFNQFAQLTPPADEGGRLLIAHEGAHRREVTAGVSAQVETIGFAPSADWQVTFDTAQRRVGLSHGGRLVTTWVNRQPGEHMAMNAATAAVLAMWLGAPPEAVAEALGTFKGLDRRLQLLGDKALGPGGRGAPTVRVYDDYGHHPTEIDATLRALREAERPEERGGRLICVFQPHQHSRTRFLLDEFAQSFSRADVVIVPHIYFVRDSEIEQAKVSARDLVDRLRERGVQAMHLYPFQAIVEQLQVICRGGDLIVVMGAGPVWQVGRDFMASDDGGGSGKVSHPVSFKT